MCVAASAESMGTYRSQKYAHGGDPSIHQYLVGVSVRDTPELRALNEVR